MTATLSQMKLTTARLCEMNSIDRSLFCTISRSRFSTWACTDTSSADVISSAMTTRAPVASTRAMAIR
jgi:hypothetical protein